MFYAKSRHEIAPTLTVREEGTAGCGEILARRLGDFHESRRGRVGVCANTRNQVRVKRLNQRLEFRRDGYLGTPQADTGELATGLEWNTTGLRWRAFAAAPRRERAYRGLRLRRHRYASTCAVARR